MPPKLIWLKFPGEIFGPDLKVALETTFPKDVVPQPNPLVSVPASIPPMDYHDDRVARYYHPAYEIGPDVGGRLIFVPRFTEESKLLRRLVFRRKMDNRDPQRGRLDMMLAREGEEKPFGFSCWKRGDKGNPTYVALDFCSKTSEFVPVFVRIEQRMPVFLKIEAEEITEGVLVSSKVVSSAEVPESLQ
ncbi:MAG: hypothetical protein HYW89_01635 [Candidatus Sungiibacteriota bacterium]|uniref:Uncharacterized protein n=1 Tax=Candidatus Sungiibacteriota bacterium TaxID=2750080 RepID=A0A7T5RK36_9BACT|nr:MAG: hypothetical protein HYW89_01635 [Candidatus Sungbacteria bacterium]